MVVTSPRHSDKRVLRTACKSLILLVAHSIPSWNQVGAWLQELNLLKSAIGPLRVAAA